MLSHPDAIPALETLATVCGGLQRGERCLIVTDAGADTSIVGQAASVLAALGGEVTIVTSSPAELPGDDPPDAVGAAMLEADLILELTSIFVGSSKARRTACEGGARYLTVPGLTWTTLRRGGPFTADFHALGEAARLIANAFDRASEFRLRSESGTDLRGSFEGRRGRPLWGVADEPGGYAAPPDVEVGASPLEGSAEGVVVVDGSLLFLGPDQLPSPVSLRFEAGRLVDAGGADAWRLLDALDRSQDEERMKVLAEVSIGLNPFSRPGGSPLELEGIVGGAHVAVGNNVAYGGSNDARSHIDCVLLRAMLELDGEPVTPAR
jgi:2,5-dihydroxypyridine 5,6-dioxygenase